MQLNKKDSVAYFQLDFKAALSFRISFYVLLNPVIKTLLFSSAEIYSKNFPILIAIDRLIILTPNDCLGYFLIATFQYPGIFQASDDISSDQISFIVLTPDAPIPGYLISPLSCHQGINKSFKPFTGVLIIRNEI